MESLQSLQLDLVKVAEEAAIQSAKWIGKGDKIAADDAAVEAMRKAFQRMNITGTVVIGEGEMDEAPMLYIGEEVGQGGVEVDIAVDPLEGTNLTAKNYPGAMTVLAVAPKGDLLHAPDMYMAKIATGQGAKGVIDINLPIEDNVKNVAAALGKRIEDMTVLMLERERHDHFAKAVRAMGAKVKFITDGDVGGALACAIPSCGVDIMVGTGGAPEGVLAAAGLRAMGGDMQGKLVPENEEERRRMVEMGITDENKVLTLNDLVKSDEVIFAASGVTTGDVLMGVTKDQEGTYTTETMVLYGKDRTIRRISTIHR